MLYVRAAGADKKNHAQPDLLNAAHNDRSITALHNTTTTTKTTTASTTYYYYYTTTTIPSRDPAAEAFFGSF